MNFDFSKLFIIAAIIGFALVLWLQEDVFRDEINGSALVVDGDSLKFNGERVRLLGIDAPELHQKCQKEGKSWKCGRAATTALKNMIGTQKVECRGVEFDRHERLLATCYVNGMNLNRNMVQTGWQCLTKAPMQASKSRPKKKKSEFGKVVSSGQASGEEIIPDTSSNQTVFSLAKGG